MITHATLTPELDCELVAFYGELDAAAAPDLQARLTEVVETSSGCLLLDLCGCTFIDSLGIAAIVGGMRAMLEADRTAAIACEHPHVRRTLGMTGVESMVALYWTRDEAMTALAAGVI